MQSNPTRRLGKREVCDRLQCGPTKLFHLWRNGKLHAPVYDGRRAFWLESWVSDYEMRLLREQFPGEFDDSEAA